MDGWDGEERRGKSGMDLFLFGKMRNPVSPGGGCRQTASRRNSRSSHFSFCGENKWTGIVVDFALGTGEKTLMGGIGMFNSVPQCRNKITTSSASQG